MDLLDYTAEDLYYDGDLPGEEAAALLHEASRSYGEPSAEAALMRAYFLEPENLTVLVALYRYFFYRHRLEECLQVAERVMQVTAARLDIDPDWSRLSVLGLVSGIERSMTLTRFHLSALKGAALLLLRMGEMEPAIHRLRKLCELDSADRLNGKALLELALARMEGMAA